MSEWLSTPPSGGKARLRWDKTKSCIDMGYGGFRRIFSRDWNRGSGWKYIMIRVDAEMYARDPGYYDRKVLPKIHQKMRQSIKMMRKKLR